MDSFGGGTYFGLLHWYCTRNGVGNADDDEEILQHKEPSVVATPNDCMRRTKLGSENEALLFGG
jgi:hypothetical protein